VWGGRCFASAVLLAGCAAGQVVLDAVDARTRRPARLVTAFIAGKPVRASRAAGCAGGRQRPRRYNPAVLPAVIPFFVEA
jgi:hypothetical protein